MFHYKQGAQAENWGFKDHFCLLTALSKNPASARPWNEKFARRACLAQNRPLSSPMKSAGATTLALSRWSLTSLSRSESLTFQLAWGLFIGVRGFQCRDSHNLRLINWLIDCLFLCCRYGHDHDRSGRFLHCRRGRVHVRCPHTPQQTNAQIYAHPEQGKV